MSWWEFRQGVFVFLFCPLFRGGSGFSLSCGQVLALVKVVRRDMRGCAGGVEGGLGSGICRWRDRGLIYLWD